MKFLSLLCTLLFLFPFPLAAEEAVTIGWIGPLSGDASVLGVDSVEVARRVFEKWNEGNSPKINFVAEDDQYKTAKTVTAYNKLVSVDKARAIFVITYGGLIAVAGRAQKDNVLLFDPLDCDEEIAALPQNVFCVAKNTEQVGIKNAEHALLKKNTPAAIIYADGDPFMPKVAAASKSVLNAGGENVVLFEGVDNATTDFKSILVKAKESKARSVFFYGNDNFGIAMRQARQLGITGQFYGLASVSSPGFNINSGDSVHGAVVAGWFAPRTERYKSFLAEHKAHTGQEPLLEVATFPTYDIANILVAGLQKSLHKKKLDVNLLRDYFYSTKNHNGISGTITVDPDGAVRTLDVGTYVYSQGNFTPVK